MSTRTPTVLEGFQLVAFIQYILDQHAPQTTLIVCSSRESFLEQLQATTSKQAHMQRRSENERDTDHAPKSSEQPSSNRESENPWSIPNLRLLKSSSTVKLAFCPDVTHLRAYLAALTYRPPAQMESTSQGTEISPMIAILNLIQLHRPTSAFSAQGLNRTIAVAVEASHQSKACLILAECATQMRADGASNQDVDDESTPPNDPPSTKPWDEEVSILNVTTKTFGAGERGWVGRTVKIRTIAQRWCKFLTLPESGS